MGIVAGWAVGGAAGLASLLAVGALFGIPAGLHHLWTTRGIASALWVLMAWLAAALPAALVVTPLF